jgi:hypothetical protein
MGGCLDLAWSDFTPQIIDTKQECDEAQGVKGDVRDTAQNFSQVGDEFCKHGITPLFVFTDQRCPKTNSLDFVDLF